MDGSTNANFPGGWETVLHRFSLNVGEFWEPGGTFGDLWSTQLVTLGTGLKDFGTQVLKM